MRLSRDPVARRRRWGLAVAATLAFALGAALGAGAGSPDRGGAPAGGTAADGGDAEAGRVDGARAEARRDGDSQPAAGDRRPLANLSLRQRVGQLVVFSFAGQELPEYARDILRERRAAGVILFGRNVASAQQVRALTGTVQRAGGRGALVMTDQEGGAIRILPFAPPAEGQGRQRTPREAADAARAAARGLRRAGVNVNLAPVLDVADEPGSPVAGRTWPGTAADVGALARAAVPVYARARVGATGKHFPGLGAATANTDFAPSTVPRSRPDLERRDLGPFRAAIAAGLPLIMASHASYPALDGRDIASQSRAVLTDLLRQDLGFRGVLVTDSMEAEAVLRRSDVPTAAVRTVRAGADLVLLTGPGSYPGVYRRLVRTAQRDPAFRARVDASVERVLALKRRLGLRLP